MWLGRPGLPPRRPTGLAAVPYPARASQCLFQNQPPTDVIPREQRDRGIPYRSSNPDRGRLRPPKRNFVAREGGFLASLGMTVARFIG